MDQDYSKMMLLIMTQ